MQKRKQWRLAKASTLLCELDALLDSLELDALKTPLEEISHEISRQLILETLRSEHSPERINDHGTRPK